MVKTIYNEDEDDDNYDIIIPLLSYYINYYCDNYFYNYTKENNRIY